MYPQVQIVGEEVTASTKTDNIKYKTRIIFSSSTSISFGHNAAISFGYKTDYESNAGKLLSAIKKMELDEELAKAIEEAVAWSHKVKIQSADLEN